MGSATLTGFAAILAWAFLALLTDLSGGVPPFQLLALTFSIGALPGLAAMLIQPKRRAALRQPFPVWALGVGGLFGYHFCYFTALANAPAVDASLIAYLWPLFIVLGSALMPGERLGWHHVAGAVMGLCGAALIVSKGGAVSFEARYAFGYGMAGLCAIIWAAYSLLSRRNASVPSDVVTGFCLVTAALGLVCHLAFEQTVWPASGAQWLAVTLLGLVPAWPCLPRMGPWRQAWQYPGAGRGKLCRAASVDACFVCRRARRACMVNAARVPVDYRRGSLGSQGPDL